MTLHVSNTIFEENRSCTNIEPAFYGPECVAKENLVKELKQACLEYGFFQLVNHAVPSDLQDCILRQSKELFDLPIEVKEKYSKGKLSTFRFSEISYGDG